MQLAFVLGRTPQLSLKEVERAATILPFQWSLSILQGELAVLKPISGSEAEQLNETSFWSKDSSELRSSIQKLQDRLGGTTRILLHYGMTQKAQIIPSLKKIIETGHPEGKLQIGLSGVGKLPVTALGLTLKKELKRSGYSVRVVLPQEGNELASAQVVGNTLAAFNNQSHFEFFLIETRDGIMIARTLTVQNIYDYQRRDFSIPVPDPVSGMVSPKLAQMMINLVGAKQGSVIYDPFCGNGRIVQEALLMGYQAYGSDILEKQVNASRTNTAWIAGEYSLDLTESLEKRIWQADATAATPPPCAGKQPYYIVSEPFLGKPLRNPLQPNVEKEWAKELVTLYSSFFVSWSKVPKQMRPQGFLMVFPAARRYSNPQLLSVFTLLFDRLGEIGYSSVQVSEYGRPDALVIRQLVHISFVESQGK